REVHRRLRDIGYETRANHDGAAFDRIGSAGGTPADTPGAVSDLCNRIRVRPRRAPHPPCSRTFRNLLHRAASCAAEVTLPGSACPGVSRRSFDSALFYRNCTAAVATRVDSQRRLPCPRCRAAVSVRGALSCAATVE